MSDVLVYLGTYTEKRPDGGGSKGIYQARFDQTTGKLGAITLAAELENPSFLAVSPDRRFLYAVSEVGTPDAAGQPSGAVAAYSIGADDGLTLINVVSSLGADPCHVNVSRSGHTVAVANYSSGSTVSFQTHADGSLGTPTRDVHAGHGPRADRQKDPHAHSVNFSPDDALLLSCDLGADRVYLYRHDPRTGAIAPHAPPFVGLEPGVGPRHLALHPSGKYAYVIAELTSSIAAFAWNAKAGSLRQMQTISTLPFGFNTPSTTAEIVVHPSGHFVYGSNRGHDSIASFAVSAKDGRLSFLAHTPTGGKAPRSFAIDPSGRWLLAANQLSDSIAAFAIDQGTGALKPTGAMSALPRPVCVLFVPPSR
ncbi:MAG TPA: lactonase family protein [Gemmatimonadaceae bacterium]|jgi:6-phosphogluconolactonase|nr:lactonase family protein [Gemmatimonadaceae bacterium]